MILRLTGARYAYISNNGDEKPVAVVNPKFLKDRSKDDDAVKSIKGRLEVSNNAKSVHPHA